MFHQNWLKYECAIFKYAPLAQKKAVKKLVSQYLKGDSDNAGTCYVLHVSTRFQVVTINILSLQIVLLPLHFNY